MFKELNYNFHVSKNICFFLNNTKCKISTKMNKIKLIFLVLETPSSSFSRMPRTISPSVKWNLVSRNKTAKCKLFKIPGKIPRQSKGRKIALNLINAYLVYLLLT